MSGEINPFLLERLTCVPVCLQRGPGGGGGGRAEAENWFLNSYCF